MVLPSGNSDTRIRRLSLVGEPEVTPPDSPGRPAGADAVRAGGTGAAAGAGNGGQAGENNAGVPLRVLASNVSGTRMRRLSFTAGGAAEEAASEALAEFEAMANGETAAAAVPAPAPQAPAAPPMDPQQEDAPRSNTDGNRASAGGDRRDSGGALDDGGSGPFFVVESLSRAGQEPGYKKTNQDAPLHLVPFGEAGQCLFGAFDGHGPQGHRASQYITRRLPELLLESGEALREAPCDTLSACFVAADDDLNASSVNTEFSGTTGVVCLAQGRTIYSAWVGDSRAVLGRRRVGDDTTHETIALSEDHKPGDPEEKQRIQLAGGRVDRLIDEDGEAIGPYRVWHPTRWTPGLAMSRSFGDMLAHRCGVCTEPTVWSVELTEADDFIILASDGVWEFVPNEEAVELVAREMPDLQAACDRLVRESCARWLVEEDGVVDDITCVIVRVQFDGGLEAAAASAAAAAAAAGGE